MEGRLFTRYFLTDGIKATAEWQASVDRPASVDGPASVDRPASVDSPDAFAVFRNGVAGAYQAFRNFSNPNEAVTEQELVRPVLELLGWADYLPQQGASRHEDIPDHLLFPDAEAKGRVASKSRSDERFRDALAVEESKRFGLPLDIRDRDDRVQPSSPHSQILRYLSTADSVTDGRIRWGLLTNGGIWRLYDYRARPRASGYLEADLTGILDQDDDDALRVFHLLFRREAFTPQEGATASFLEIALAEGRRYEERVAQDLSRVVFESVFPQLIEALADAAGESLASARQAALVFLYRLLFLLYAEDRGLLPVNDSRYDDYGMRNRVRDDIARRTANGDAFSASAASYYGHLMTLFRLIDKGDASIGLPPYNGGLFAPEAAPLLEKATLADATLAPIIYNLSHTETDGGRLFVNYRLEQLPIIAPADYDRHFGNKTAGELVRDHVLRLTYTAHDMAPFARDLGYDGPPFIWNEEERRTSAPSTSTSMVWTVKTRPTCWAPSP